MNNKIWEPIMIKYFITILQNDTQIDKTRQEIVSNENFNLEALFDHLDNESKNSLNLFDFQNILKNVNYAEDHLRKFIHNYDKDNDFAINFEEFKNLILPRYNSELRNKALNGNRGELTSNIISSFVYLIRQEMSLVKELAELAETLINTKDFTSYEAFLAIDVNNFKYIEYSNLLNYLGKNGYNVREEEACSIIYRLDTDNDERISYDEFQQIFFPISYYGGVVKRDNTDYESAVDFKKEEFRDENEVSYEVNRDLAESNNFNRSDFDNQAKDTGLSYQRSPRPEVSTGTSFYRARKNYTSSVSPIRPALKYDYTLSPNRPREIVSSSRRLYSPEKTKYAEKTLYSPYRVNLTKSPERQRYISPNRTNRTNRSPLTRSECSPKISRMPETSYLKNKTNSSLIAKYFYEILSLDLNAESLKEALSVKSDINIRDLFNYFDLTGRSYISLVDMKEVLKELDIFANLDNIKLLYKRFDKDLDGRLDISEFSLLVTPIKYEYANLIHKRVPGYYSELSYDSRKTLINLMRSLLEAEATAEKQRKILNNTYGFSSYEMFEMIKSRYNSYISKSDLIAFMQENGYGLTPFEQDSLFDRIDKNKDGRISFNEFIHELINRL